MFNHKSDLFFLSLFFLKKKSFKHESNVRRQGCRQKDKKTHRKTERQKDRQTEKLDKMKE